MSASLRLPPSLVQNRFANAFQAGGKEGQEGVGGAEAGARAMGDILGVYQKSPEQLEKERQEQIAARRFKRKKLNYDVTFKYPLGAMLLYPNRTTLCTRKHYGDGNKQFHTFSELLDRRQKYEVDLVMSGMNEKKRQEIQQAELKYQQDIRSGKRRKVQKNMKPEEHIYNR